MTIRTAKGLTSDEQTIDCLDGADLNLAFAMPVAEATRGLVTTGSIGSAVSSIVQNTSVYPWDAVCYITVNFAGVGDFRGSGVIIGPHTILTAAHVVWD